MSVPHIIVTIDGPAGTGKSTVARALARRLGFGYLDTGAMYRAVALACLEQQLAPDAPDCARIARELPLHMDAERVWIDERDVTQAIRQERVSEAASVVAQNQEVRKTLVELQRRVAARGDFVCEGRDQGTVVFPTATWKFFLTADPAVRAARRHRELTARGIDVTLDEIAQQQEERDRRDQERAESPLRPADDAITIDTTELSSDAVVNRLAEIIAGGTSG